VSVRFGSRPRAIPAVLVAVAVMLLVGLGVWQLDRAEQKRRIAAEYAERLTDEVVRLGEVAIQTDTDADALRFRRVRVEGSFDSLHQFLLDNRVHEGAVGYEVVTPLRFGEGGGIVLVDRGWVPQGSDRGSLPSIGVGSGPRTLTGLVTHFPQPGLKIGPADAGVAGWPRVIEYFDPELVGRQLGAQVLPFLLLLDPREADGYVRHWKPPASGAERHVAYAVQWFALAIALLILFGAASARRKIGGMPSGSD
jgi:surfeit locus 1 family protein